MDDSTPISYLALEVGTPVQDSSGKTIGKVEHVLQLPEEDLFDGIVLSTDRGLRFVDRTRYFRSRQTLSTARSLTRRPQICQRQRGLPPSTSTLFRTSDHP